VAVEPGRVARIEIALAVAPDVVCEVRGPDGAVVPGAEVRVAVTPAASSRARHWALWRVTDHAGRCSFPTPIDVPPPWAEIRARKDGVGSGGLPLSPKEAARVVVVTLRAPKPESASSSDGFISGIAKDFVSGRALPGVVIEAHGPGSFDEREPPVTTSTAADGTFELSGLRRASVRIDSGSPRWVLKFVEREPSGGWFQLKDVPRHEGVVVRLTEGGCVEGTVLDQAGQPVGGVGIAASAGIIGKPPAVTDAAGRFRLERVQPSPRAKVWAVRARVPAVSSEPFELLPGATVTGVSMTVASAPALVVEVVGVDGRRVPGVAVEVIDGDAREEGAPRVLHRTDASGRFVVETLAATQAWLRVEPGTLPAGAFVDDDFKNPVFLGDRETTTATLRLRGERLIRGTVVLDGSPVAGIIRFDVWEDPEKTFDGRPYTTPQNRLGQSNRPRHVRADARGEFVLRVRSLDRFQLTEVTRVVRDASGSPTLEVLVPASPGQEARDLGEPIALRRGS
jgi:hypothetical protein